jgi:hypothetical protein
VGPQYPFLSRFFELRQELVTQSGTSVATRTFTAARESLDQDESRPERSTGSLAALGTSTMTRTREEPDSDPSRATESQRAVDTLGTETFTKAREDPDADRGVPEAGTHTMTNASGESADSDASRGSGWLEAQLL